MVRAGADKALLLQSAEEAPHCEVCLEPYDESLGGVVGVKCWERTKLLCSKCFLASKKCASISLPSLSFQLLLLINLTTIGKRSNLCPFCRLPLEEVPLDFSQKVKIINESIDHKSAQCPDCKHLFDTEGSYAPMPLLRTSNSKLCISCEKCASAST